MDLQEHQDLVDLVELQDLQEHQDQVELLE